MRGIKGRQALLTNVQCYLYDDSRPFFLHTGQKLEANKGKRASEE
jgi:hypothetical protein